MDKAFSEFKSSSIILKNRFIKSATFEGMYDDGLPNQKLINHHVDLAKGGVALTTVSYGAVSPEGRTFENQMCICKSSLEKLKVLASEVHKAGGKVSMQLTHCGFFSKNKGIKQALAPSSVFNAYGLLSGLGFSKEMTLRDLDKVKSDFANAARSLKEIGFDAVEIHMGHGYLLSQFLSPITNKRNDEYGGSVEGRSRFPIEVFKAVKKAVSNDFGVLVKLNLSDGLKKGFSIEDCKYVSRKLEDCGCTAIVLSGGFTSKTPFYLMRGEVPLSGMAKNGETLAEKITMAIFGPIIVKTYKFEPNFFLNQAKVIREAVKMPLVYLGGVNSKENIQEIITAGFDLIAMARPLIYDSDFINKLKNNEVTETGCDRCNQCVVEMDRDGIKCVLTDD